jgi:hypothetical protein
MTATKICAGRTWPVSRSTITGTVSPAHGSGLWPARGQAPSTNSLSPPMSACRIVTDSRDAQLRYSSQKRE